MKNQFILLFTICLLIITVIFPVSCQTIYRNVKTTIHKAREVGACQLPENKYTTQYTNY